MPQIVAAALAQTAVAAPVAAATIAPTAAGIGTAAAQTAALEAAKQAAIKEGVKQAGLEATKQAGLEAGKQAAVEASKQAAQQGIAQGAQQVGSDAARNQVIEAFKTSQAQPGTFPELGKFAGEVTSVPGAPAGTPAGLQSAYGPAATPTPAAPITPAAPPTPAGSVPPLGSQSSAIPEAVRTANPIDLAQQNQMFQQSSKVAEKFAADRAAEQLAADPLRQGIAKGVELVKKYPMESGLALMSAGQYMNQPEEEDKGKYKSKVDMSEFQPSLPSVGEFKPSYEYQKYAAKGGLMGYAVGGPVETMSAQNTVGDNTMYPQSQLQTPMYSNPTMQRPMPTVVVSQGLDAPVNSYTGEPKFAEGGVSDEMAREYGLKNRKQRAAKSLTKDYEEMEAQRTKDANELLSERSGSGIIPRSRTQQLSSPFSAAIEEHNRLAKKTKTPKFETPKTSLGDIDTYMDVPIEAASGGIMGNLGSYSDGGRLLRGPGDGVSDSIPAVIGKRQPARLADGEFVIPARIVSELGNGSTEAGARKLYAMMDRIQNTRKKSIGKKKVAVNSRADKHLPA